MKKEEEKKKQRQPNQDDRVYCFIMRQFVFKINKTVLF